jgi:hypothetical protein
LTDRLPGVVVGNGDLWPPGRHRGSQRQLGSKCQEAQPIFRGGPLTWQLLRDLGELASGPISKGHAHRRPRRRAELWRSKCHGTATWGRSLSCSRTLPSCERQEKTRTMNPRAASSAIYRTKSPKPLNLSWRPRVLAVKQRTSSNPRGVVPSLRRNPSPA